MIPSFIPIIGRDFSDVGNQQYQWQGFNRQVEEDNLRRAQAAEGARNNWLAQLSQLQEHAADRDVAGQASAARLAREDAAAAEDRRRFDVGTGLTREQMGIEKQRYQFTQDQKNKQERQALDAIENFGEAKGDEVSKAGKQRDSAESDLTGALTELRTRGSELAAKAAPGKVTFNVGTGTLMSVRGQTLLPDENKAIAQANEELAPLRAAYDAANTNFQFHLKNFRELEQEAAKNKLTVTKDDQGNYQLFSPWHKKSFGKKQQKEPDKVAAEETPALPDWLAGPRLDMSATPESTAWAGFNAAPAAPPAAPVGNVNFAPLRVGRFVVTPR